MQNNELKKREKEPLQELDWHLSTRGIVSNKLFHNLWHLFFIKYRMESLLRLTDPERMSNNAKEFKAKRDRDNIPKQSKIYWHNKIVSLYRDAELLLSTSTMNDKDVEHYGITREEIREVLDIIKDEYEIYTYRKNILNK